MFGRKMEIFFVTGYCTSQKSVLDFKFAFLITQIMISHGSLLMDETSERNGMVTQESTTTYSLSTIAKIGSTTKDKLENENTTPTVTPENINGLDQFANDNETKLLKAETVDCESEGDNTRLISTIQTCIEHDDTITDYPLNGSTQIDSFLQNAVSVAFISVGLFASVLNLTVIFVVYSTEKLRRNTYLNLILTLSVSDFLFGLTTLLTGIRRLFPFLSQIKELCILSNLFAPACLVVTLYQSFLISLHRYLVISRSEWSEILFKQKRKYIWYILCWVTVIGPLLFFISPDPKEVNRSCSIDTVFFENRFIAVCIVVIMSLVYMLLILVFYCMAMYSLKRHYLNRTNATCSDTILENKRKTFSKSMRSVSILLLVMVIFSGPSLVCNLISLIQDIPLISLFITFTLANIHSILNPLIYYMNIVEFNEALTRPCSRPPT